MECTIKSTCAIGSSLMASQPNCVIFLMIRKVTRCACLRHTLADTCSMLSEADFMLCGKMPLHVRWQEEDVSPWKPDANARGPSGVEPRHNSVLPRATVSNCLQEDRLLRPIAARVTAAARNSCGALCSPILHNEVAQHLQPS